MHQADKGRVVVVACVGRTRSTQPPTQKKGRQQNKFALPRFGLKYLAAPIPALQNLSSPPSPSAPRLLKSLIRRQPSNRPSSRLFPHRSPPLCRTTTTKTTVALHHRTGATSSTPSSTAPGGPPTTSAAATDVPHRHRLPPHQVHFTDTVSQLTGATSPSTSSHLRPRGRWGFTNGLVHRIIALRCHSRSASVRGQPTPAHHPQRL